MITNNHENQSVTRSTRLAVYPGKKGLSLKEKKESLIKNTERENAMKSIKPKLAWEMVALTINLA